MEVVLTSKKKFGKSITRNALSIIPLDAVKFIWVIYCMGLSTIICNGYMQLLHEMFSQFWLCQIYIMVCQCKRFAN